MHSVSNSCKHAHSGRSDNHKNPNRISRMALPVLGLGSALWFLIRVIPKPSRAQYPCMKVAAPLASGFAAYLAALSISVFAVKKARQRLFEARFAAAGLFILLGLTGLFWLSHTSDTPANAMVQGDDPVNQPMGQAVGIFPGRVVWNWNPDATNEQCTNKSGDYFWQDENNNQAVIDQMLSQTLRQLAGEETDEAAWDALFRYYNRQHGKGDVGYQAGEKVVVKINIGCEWSRQYDSKTLEWIDNNRNNLNRTDATPQMVLAILRQIISKAGVDQSDIGVGDPIRLFTGPYYQLCHDEFPDVAYWSCNAKAGRTQIHPTEDPVIFYSDGEDEDKLWEELVEADYMINMPVIKGHARAGITAGPKNHFGSHSRTSGASHLHRSLPSAGDNGTMDNGEMGSYRCHVDIMGHKDLGGKTLLYVVDGLWGSSEAVQPPNKWKMQPFVEDWPSSIFVAQDPVALESVCFDFLYEEFNLDHYTSSFFTGNVPYPHQPGVQDYIHQAADPANWPAGLEYDPEDDGTVLGSLGVHEHWNNPVDMQYTRNLGTGEGIELVKVHEAASCIDCDSQDSPCVYNLGENFPDPFNPSTQIPYELSAPARVRLDVYDVRGKRIQTLVNSMQVSGRHQAIWTGMASDGSRAPSGLYFYRIQVSGAGIQKAETGRMVLLK